MLFIVFGIISPVVELFLGLVKLFLFVDCHFLHSSLVGHVLEHVEALLDHKFSESYLIFHVKDGPLRVTTQSGLRIILLARLLLRKCSLRFSRILGRIGRTFSFFLIILAKVVGHLE